MRSRKLFLSIFRSFVISVVRPYIYSELPGWGTLYAIFVGGYQRNWLWEGLEKAQIRGKVHGYKMTLDLGKWADRSAFFLGRWYDLSTQLAVMEILREGDIVVDIGANKGDFCLVASHLVGKTGRVLSFEPNPNCCQLLRDHIALNKIKNIELESVGLSNETSHMILTVPKINNGEGSFAPLPQYEDVYKVKVPVRRGDDALMAINPMVIKIDVEGFECNVIHGLDKTLKRSKPLVITEIVASHLQRAGSTSSGLVSMMEELGYKGYRIGVVRRGIGACGMRLVLSELDLKDHSFDALWIHSENAHQRLLARYFI